MIWAWIYHGSLLSICKIINLPRLIIVVLNVYCNHFQSCSRVHCTHALPVSRNLLSLDHCSLLLTCNIVYIIYL